MWNVKDNPTFALQHSGGGILGQTQTLILEKQRVEVRNELPFITLRRLAQAVPLQACIQEVPGLNLYRSGQYYATHFRSFPHSLRKIAVII